MMRHLKEGLLNIHLPVAPQNIVGPFFGNVHQITAKIKKALDPKGIAHPTHLIDMEEL